MGWVRLRQHGSRLHRLLPTTSIRSPTGSAPYRLEDMRFYSHKTTILPANWKVVVDAFNEGYHVQGTHPQILAWTDDVNMEYEQFGTHAHYGRLPSAQTAASPESAARHPRRGCRRVGDPRRRSSADSVGSSTATRGGSSTS